MWINCADVKGSPGGRQVPPSTQTSRLPGIPLCSRQDLQPQHQAPALAECKLSDSTTDQLMPATYSVY